MATPVARLDRRWLWEPMAGSTEAGAAIAEMVAGEDLSVVDLWSIASAATLRCRFAWMTPDAANARLAVLEAGLADMKLRLHAAEMEAERSRSELAVCRGVLADARTDVLSDLPSGPDVPLPRHRIAAVGASV